MDQQEFDALIEREKTYLAGNLRKIGFQEESAKLAAERFLSLKAVQKSSYHPYDFGFAMNLITRKFNCSEDVGLSIVVTVMRIGRAIKDKRVNLDFDEEVSAPQEFHCFIEEIKSSGAKKQFPSKPQFQDLPEDIGDEICKKTQFMSVEEEAYFAYKLLAKFEYEPFENVPEEFLDNLVYQPIIVPAREYNAWLLSERSGGHPQP